MNDRPKMRFSLSTLLLLIVIVGQVFSQLVMLRELSQARAEVEQIRRKFGYIHVENDHQVFVARIAENENNSPAYRIHIPPGHHYLINVTETVFPAEGYPADPQPSKSMSMNSWREGAEVVLSYAIRTENGVRTLRVWTETEELFRYQLKNQSPATGMRDGAHLITDPQKAFSPDDTIRFMFSKDVQTRQGIMLWMEPAAVWEARHASK